MRLTKFTHSCVRIAHDGGVLVIDPGVWSEPGALRGADAVLITHEHGDHADMLRLAGAGLPVYAPAEARLGELGERLDLTRVRPGERFTAAGLDVTAVGGRHATIYGGKPDCANLGYLVDDRIYHPGDSVHRPESSVELLCVPMQASWLKTVEAIDFVRAVAPERAIGIHDGQINDRGLEATNGWLDEETDHGYRHLRPGESLEL